MMRIVKEYDERRNEIIDTAKKLFITKGYNKSSVNDILNEIGIAKGTFYYYFASKEEGWKRSVKIKRCPVTKNC